VPFSGRPSDRAIYEAHDAGRIHRLPIDPDSLRATSLLDTVSRSELASVLLSLNPIDALRWRGVSLSDWLGQATTQPVVRRFFEAAVRLATYTNAPELLDAGFALQLVGGRPAALLLDGGWQTLVDGLEQAARAAGARLITGARVVAIDPGEAGHLVRLADGSMLEADSVVLATEPQVAAQLVADGRHTLLQRWAKQTQPLYAACLDLALQRLPNPRRLVVLHLDRPLYYSVHSRSSRLAPPGGALLHLIKYHRPGQSGDARADRQELETWLDDLQPGWRDQVVAQQFLPHIQVAGDMIQARRNGLAGRPGPAVPGLRNLYVVGDWVGQEDHLANAGFASARQVAQQILSHEC
jgi:phytoene dehydrogenase-like protein